MSGLHQCPYCHYRFEDAESLNLHLEGRGCPESDPESVSTVCLDSGPDCSGTVEYRTPLSATGVSFPRCEHHWGQRLDTQAGIDRRYPDSPFPPSDFDPSYAGESWDDD
jgi:hypothetical protein